jgi:hypothetical protein
MIAREFKGKLWPPENQAKRPIDFTADFVDPAVRGI